MKTVGSIKDAEEFDENALNLLVAGKMGLGLINLELDSEWALDYGDSDHTLWLPQVFALVGRRLFYGGEGIGCGYLDQEWFDRPVYTLRAGVNIPLGAVSVAYADQNEKDHAALGRAVRRGEKMAGGRLSVDPRPVAFAGCYFFATYGFEA